MARLPQSIPTRAFFHIPEEIIEFFAVFGGEKALLKTYYCLYSAEDLIGALGHIVFATDPRSAVDFGISHEMLRFDDPSVETTETWRRDNVFAWSDYCDSVDDCLVQFACRNMCESLPYILHIDDTTSPRINSELTAYATIPLTKSGEPGVRCQPFYAPGAIICLDLVEKSAMIGLDTLERALAFQTKHDWGFEEIFEEP